MTIVKIKPRRTFIKTSLWASFFTLLAPTKGWSSVKKPYLMQVFKDEGIVRSIGNKYLIQFPGEKEQLRELLTGVDDMNKQSAKEFRAANFVTVDGWVLAQSEARECAWFYLKTSGHAY